MDDNNKCAQMDNDQEDCVNMCNSLKKVIIRIKEKIRLEKRSMKAQAENNLGSQINMMMLNMVADQMQIAEVYSFPRDAEMAGQMGLRGGGGVWISRRVTQMEGPGILTASL